jgi:hypothetical protein
MKTVVAIAAVAGAAAVSSADVGGFSFVAPTQVVEGSTFQVDLVATGDEPNAIVAFNVQIDAAGAAGVSAPTAADFNAALFAFNTFAGAGDFDASGGTNVFAKASLDSGAILFSFDVTAGAAGSTIDLSSAAGTVDALSTLAYGLDVGFFLDDTPYGTVNFGSASVRVIPTPGVAGLLGLSGLAVARRRR